MSAYTGVVTTRDVLEWAIDQGVFTDDRTHAGNPHRSVIGDFAGPWTEILYALVQCVAERLADRSIPVFERGGLEGFEEYVEARCLQNLTHVFGLTTAQIDVVRSLAQEFRLFFDASVLNMSSAGLDGPITGDLDYHCGFDYGIEIPDWVSNHDL